METGYKVSFGYMIFASILAIILGLVMLFYPGGTMVLMAAAFQVLQIIISIFILAYAISEAIRYFKANRKAHGIIYLLIGAAATLLVWIFNVQIVYLIVSLFLILVGIGEIAGSFSIAAGRYFLLFLGLINIMIGAMIIKYPVVLPLIIAWYVLFWGVSRLFLALEIRRIMHQ